MSGGPVCKCPENQKPINEREWFVWDYKCNYSLFNGGWYQRSDYSCIYCKKCGYFWRTKAKYVTKLGHLTDEQKLTELSK